MWLFPHMTKVTCLHSHNFMKIMNKCSFSQFLNIILKLSRLGIIDYYDLDELKNISYEDAEKMLEELEEV